MRIEKQRQRRAERERGVGAVGAEARSFRRSEGELLLWHAGKDRSVTAEFCRNQDDRGEHRHEDEHVLDDGDERRRPQAAGLGEGGGNGRREGGWETVEQG